MVRLERRSAAPPGDHYFVAALSQWSRVYVLHSGCMDALPLIITIAWMILVLSALLVVEERERRPMRYKAPAASMVPPRSRDVIPATTLAGTMAGLSPAMTSEAGY